MKTAVTNVAPSAGAPTASEWSVLVNKLAALPTDQARKAFDLLDGALTDKGTAVGNTLRVIERRQDRGFVVPKAGE